MSAYQLLGIKAGETLKDSDINSTYEMMLARPLEQGYSKATIEGRAELLEIARGDILSNKGRSKERKDITIPLDLLPGALAVLAEVWMA